MPAQCGLFHIRQIQAAFWSERVKASPGDGLNLMLAGR